MNTPRATSQPDWQPPPISDHMRRVELLISNLLRVGVLLSVLLIAIGTVTSFVQHRAYLSAPDELPALIDPREALPHSFSDVVAGLRALHGEAIVVLGLLVLIATPMMRVAVSTAAFLKEHDRDYMLITLVVFCLLILSLVLGRAE